jgi:hypothetical protein
MNEVRTLDEDENCGAQFRYDRLRQREGKECGGSWNAFAPLPELRD